jgi:hypothetical protein
MLYEIAIRGHHASSWQSYCRGIVADVKLIRSSSMDSNAVPVLDVAWEIEFFGRCGCCTVGVVPGTPARGHKTERQGSSLLELAKYNNKVRDNYDGDLS